MNYKHSYYCAMRKRSQIIRLPILNRLRVVFEFYIRIENCGEFHVDIPSNCRTSSASDNSACNMRTTHRSTIDSLAHIAKSCENHM